MFGLKQRQTTILLGVLSLISFCLGHASINVHDFWNEPIILWMAIVLPTGLGVTYLIKSNQCIYTNRLKAV